MIGMGENLNTGGDFGMVHLINWGLGQYPHSRPLTQRLDSTSRYASVRSHMLHGLIIMSEIAFSPTL
jgi:hypothetical protein